MAINKNSTGFTILFAVLMVIIVGGILSFTAMKLKPMQEKNDRVKKMADILNALKLDADRSNAEELFEEYISNTMVLNHKGEPVEGELEAFDINVRQQFRDKALSDEEKFYPLYMAELDGKKYYVVPMVGKGLWGPIWGFVSLESNLNEIYGASFDHEGETPGLGAEINTDAFESQFDGKEILNEEGEMVSVLVRKGGALEGNDHQVDGITGGTITSNGVTEMLDRTFGLYNQYFKNLRSNGQMTSIE
ncbi:NADH:ubiquinone reductase (Na(+)-transporting) subunit C [Halocola ammonii]